MNSKRTRVEPVFGWLEQHGEADWPAKLLGLADGLAVDIQAGRMLEAHYHEEVRVAASPTRLKWLIRNAHRLAPRDGRKWKEYRRRVIDNPKRGKALAILDAGERRGVPKKLILEGKTSCDCFLECE